MGLKKKIVALVFVIIILCPVIAFHTLSICKKIVQYEMEEKMERTLLQTIVAKNGSFEWIKINKEILINGKMFDVKSFLKSADETIFNGLYDEDEKKIIKDINELTDKKNESSLPILQLLKIFLATYSIEERCLAEYEFLKNSKKTYSIYDESLVHQTISIHYPPPNL